MKTVVLLILLVIAAAMYFGYEPYDLIPSLRPAPVPPPRHSHVPTSQTTPEPHLARNTTIVNVEAPDGSLEQRWKIAPSPKP